MFESLKKVREQIFSTWNTFQKARGEWNDGYCQGLKDAMSLIDDELWITGFSNQDPELMSHEEKFDHFKENFKKFKKENNELN
jgi:hypothetical protein